MTRCRRWPGPCCRRGTRSQCRAMMAEHFSGLIQLLEQIPSCTACFAIRCNVIKSAACCSPSSHSCKWPGKGRKVSVAAEIVDVEKPGDTVEP